MKIGIILIIIGCILFGGNIAFVTMPPLWAAIFRTFLLPFGLIAWGALRIHSSHKKPVVKDRQ